MKYRVERELPDRKRPYTSLQTFLREFLASNEKIISFDPIENGYKNCGSAASSVSGSLRRLRCRTVCVTVRNDRVYIFKTE